MKKRQFYALILAAGLLMHSCYAVNKLGNYDFREKTLAADFEMDPFIDHLVIEKEEADESQFTIVNILNDAKSLLTDAETLLIAARVDSAMRELNVPEYVTGQMLRKGSEILDMNITEDRVNADFMFKVRFEEYRLESTSYESDVFLVYNIIVTMVDIKTGANVWRIQESGSEKLDVSTLASEAAFLLDAKVITLFDLETEEIVGGMRTNADHLVEKILSKLQIDLTTSRNKN
ncbi:hypothetical protein ACFL6I_03350 [candidate division KSB1 bacterium]